MFHNKEVGSLNCGLEQDISPTGRLNAASVWMMHDLRVLVSLNYRLISPIATWEKPLGHSLSQFPVKRLSHERESSSVIWLVETTERSSVPVYEGLDTQGSGTGFLFLQMWELEVLTLTLYFLSFFVHSKYQFSLQFVVKLIL